MNNRKKANQLTLGILAIVTGIVLMILAFPKTMAASLTSIGLLIALYFITRAMRNTIEDHLDEKNKNDKWKQEKNIK